jgi:hypothetical protein
MSEAEVRRIPLRLSGEEGGDYEAWPVTQGMPFACGHLEAGARRAQALLGVRRGL